MWVGGWNRLSSGAGAGVDSCCVDCTSRTSAQGSRVGSGAEGGRELDLGLILVPETCTGSVSGIDVGAGSGSGAGDGADSSVGDRATLSPG